LKRERRRRLRFRRSSMIKRFTVLRCRDDVSRDAAFDHWITAHARLVERVPGVVRYVQRRCTSDVGSAADATLLGIGEVWFETRGDAVAAAGSPEGAAGSGGGRELGQAAQ